MFDKRTITVRPGRARRARRRLTNRRIAPQFASNSLRRSYAGRNEVCGPKAAGCWRGTGPRQTETVDIAKGPGQ